MRDCLVVGSGVAGLVAALELARNGCKVTLVEAKKHCGGRAYSFSDPRTGMEVDNGQHLIMGCYSVFLGFLKDIGADHKLRRVSPLRIPFRHASGQRAELKLRTGSGKSGVVRGILGFRALPLKDRFRALRVGAALQSLDERKLGALDGETAAHWLAGLGQSEEAIRNLWSVICLATLNTKPERASAKMLAVVLKEVFFGVRDASDLLLPEVSLTRLYVDDALRELSRRNGTIVTGNGVKRLVVNNGIVCGVVLKDGMLLEPSAVVLATPWKETGKLAGSLWPDETLSAVVSRLSPSPIYSLTFFIEKPITTEPMLGLLGTNIQWIFTRKIVRDLWMHTCVISAAVFEEGRPPQADVFKELEHLFPELEKFQPRGIRTLLERSATFEATPGLERIRPGPRTPARNLFLAGDWTDTGLPSTLEGAARSGYTAADMVTSYLEEVCDVEPGTATKFPRHRAEIP